jgi:co-chaperonin GroES (HSP10)
MSNVIATVSPYSTGLDVSDRSIEDLFPDVDPECEPLGSKVLVQLRRVLLMSRGGIQLVEETGDTEAWNIQIGKVIALGPLAFKNRKTGDPWPEGLWVKVGEYVRFPRWGGDRLTIDLEDGNKPVVILILEDYHMLVKYKGDPRKVRAYLE